MATISSETFAWKQGISKDIPSYGSLSKRMNIAIHWFGKY